MNTKAYVDNLFDCLEELAHADHWLQRSFSKCARFKADHTLNDEQYDDLEAFTSRFARASDLLVQKVFRAVDAAELESGGTLLDAVNRAEKRGIIAGVDDIRKIREVRNEISHEYVSENLAALLTQVASLTPVLREAIKKTQEYCRHYKPQRK
jgi:hypothetical protein